MVDIQLVEPSNKNQVNEFVQFHYDLYKSCPQWGTPFYSDIKMMLNKNKHPFFEHSDADYFIARQNGKVVGRIAAIENKSYNRHHHSNDASFYLFDSIDDQQVANALFDALRDWVHKRGLTRIVGPKGFSGLDGYGILVEGFEHRQMMNMMNYKLSLLSTFFLNRLVSKKRMNLSPVIFKPMLSICPRKYMKFLDGLRTRSFWVKHFKSKKELVEWGPRMGEIYNNSFINNWEYYPLTQKEIKYSIDNVLMVAIPNILS